MNTVIAEHIQKMGKYHAPTERGRHKIRDLSFDSKDDGLNPKNFSFDFNERTVEIPERIARAVADFILRGNTFNMYPEYGDIVEKVAGYVGVRPGQVMLTNGSDQAIDVLFRAARQGGTAIIPSPSFAMYTQSAETIEGMKIDSPPTYTMEGGFPTDDILKAIDSSTNLIVIPNPNNPTGTAVEIKDILKIAKAAPNAIILVDECHFGCTGITPKDYMDKYPNIAITRTFSKEHGLADLRIGCVMANEEIIQNLMKIRAPYDINMIAVVALRAALEDPQYAHDYINEVMQQSKPILEKFLKEKGITFWKSDANFIFMFPPNPEKIFNELESRGIFVRKKKDGEGNLGLRVTVGTVQQTMEFVKALGEILDMQEPKVSQERVSHLCESRQQAAAGLAKTKQG